MRPLALVLTLLAACSASPAPRATIPVTLFGPEARLDAWAPSVVQGGHVHASQEGPCLMPAMAEAAGAGAKLLPPPKNQQAEPFAEALRTGFDRFCVQLHGAAYGGPNRTALTLRRYAENSPAPVEALVVLFPRLKPGDPDRLFTGREVDAVLERPLRTVEARLDRGWVRAEAGRYELFLVLKPVRADAGYESIQVVTRVEPPAR